MYEKEQLIAEKQPEHIAFATNMTNELISSFDPIKINEAVLHILKRVKEDRLFKIEQAEKQLCFLKETFDRLNSNA